jgi:hypothetical protein
LHFNNNNKTEAGLNFVLNSKFEGTYKDTIQPRSTQVLIFKGDSITKINYTNDDFDNERPPVYSKKNLTKM